MTENIEVVGLGALNIDHLYRVERILEDGESVVNEAISSPGGSAANTIYGLARLGVATGFCGIVGDDAEGRILIEDFEKDGVDTTQIRTATGAKTGSVLCLSDRQGRRSLYVTPAANSLLTGDDLDPAYINRAKLLHLSSFAGEEQFEVLLNLMDRLSPSTRLSFAPGALYAAKGLDALRPIIARTHVLFANRDEIGQLSGEEISGGVKICLDLGCDIVAVTLGRGARVELGQGAGCRTVTAICYLRSAEREEVIEPARDMASGVDTTGAGDAFATGFLYGLLKGKGLRECGRLGDTAARCSISQAGARKGLPTAQELGQHYRRLCSQEL